MTVFNDNKTGRTNIVDILIIAAFLLACFMGVMVLLGMAAYGAPPTRLAFDNLNANSNYWRKVLITVYHCPTNPAKSWTAAKWAYDDVLSPTNKNIHLEAENPLTMSSLPPVESWPVLAKIWGTTNVQMTVPIPKGYQSDFFRVGFVYVP